METVAEKGIGSLLRPWQIRRDGRAQTDVRREELLVLAQASRDAEDIRVGRTRLLVSGDIVPAELGHIHTEVVTEPPGPVHRIAASITQAAIADRVREEVNVAKALLQAENELADSKHDAPATRVDDDWLYRWRDSAGAVSQEQLQSLWGSVLAGEIKSPGSFSLRTLEFLRNISEDEAKEIERLAALVIGNFVLRDDSALGEADITFSFLLGMQELGIISGVEGLGLEMTFKSSQPDSFVVLFGAGDHGVRITHADAAMLLKLPTYQVGTIGVQVLRLGRCNASASTLRHVGRLACAQGFAASLVRLEDLGNGKARFSNPEDLCAKRDSQASAAPT